MKTIQTVLQQLTDPQRILRELCDTLRTVDSSFPDVEAKYLSAASALEEALGSGITPSVREFLAAREAEYAAEAVYIGWQGFQLNIDIFTAPVNAVLLRGDYPELHRESRLGTLPMAWEPRETANAFHKVIREKHRDKLELTDEITDFYSYLRTAGYKLAHYFGFRLADRFLPYVIPGYASDPVNTMYYRSYLQKHLNIDIEKMDK